MEKTLKEIIIDQMFGRSNDGTSVRTNEQMKKLKYKKFESDHIPFGTGSNVFGSDRIRMEKMAQIGF